MEKSRHLKNTAWHGQLTDHGTVIPPQIERIGNISTSDKTLVGEIWFMVVCVG
jgi:hypothetical protein